MALNQVKEYHGQRCKLDMKNGKKIEGALAFYNFEQQIIYLSSYVIFNKEGTETLTKGKFIIVNQREWSTLRIE